MVRANVDARRCRCILEGLAGGLRLEVVSPWAMAGVEAGGMAVEEEKDDEEEDEDEEDVEDVEAVDELEEEEEEEDGVCFTEAIWSWACICFAGILVPLILGTLEEALCASITTATQATIKW